MRSELLGEVRGLSRVWGLSRGSDEGRKVPSTHKPGKRARLAGDDVDEPRVKRDEGSRRTDTAA